MDSDKLIFGIIGGVTILITAIIIITSFTNTPVSEFDQDELIGENPHVKGAENPRAILVKFSDFQCSACAQYAPIVQNLVNQYPNELQVVYRHFPLGIFPWSVNAARAAEAAALQGRFWDYHDELFVSQFEMNEASFGEDGFIRFAEALNLDIERFESDYASSDVINRVQRDANLARQLGLSATPTFFLIADGQAERLSLASFDDLERIVREAVGNPSGSAGSGAGIPEDVPENIGMALILDLVNVQRDDIRPSDVELVSVEPMEWSDSSLGCPVEGEMYAQVITPGFRAVLSAQGEEFVYHTDAEVENLVLCSTD